MRTVALYSILLVIGLVGSQFVPPDATVLRLAITAATMVALSYIMIHVGYEFELDRSRPRQYLWDYLVAGTAATFPWILVTGYFVFVMAPRELWSHPDLWRETLLQARFTSPTSAGVLFSMLAAAGLAATWVFRKARILAIFDDLDTILLLIPLQIMMVGFRWPMLVLVGLLSIMLWCAWKFLHAWKIPVSWPFVLAYAAAIALASDLFYRGSKVVAPDAPLHLEVLLPAFVLGCVLARPAHGHNPHADDAHEDTQPGPAERTEQRVSMIISALFMVLVGLSMPSIFTTAPSAPSASLPQGLSYSGADPAALAAKDAFPGWGMIALHVLAVTLLANLGKMFPALCYRKEATLRERLAVSIGMWPRGEVGAGVLVISVGYGIGGPVLTVAALSLAVNLLLTGVFILMVRKLLVNSDSPTPPTSNPAPWPPTTPLVRRGRE